VRRPEPMPVMDIIEKAKVSIAARQETKVEPGELVVFVFENAFFQPAPLNIQVGDLFFTKESLYFTAYSGFTSTGSAGALVGLLMGGVAGGAAASTGDDNSRNAAIKVADQIRKSYWGLNLGYRLKLSPKAIAISRNAILDIGFDTNIISLRTSERNIEFAVNHLIDNKEKLLLWQLGKLSTPIDCAITSKHPAPWWAFNSSFEGKRDRDLLDELNQASSDKEYMQHVWEAYGVLSTKKRQSFVRSFDKIEGSFKDAFWNLRQTTIASGRNTLNTGLLALAPTAILSILLAFAANFLEKQTANAIGFFWALMCLFSAFFGIPRIVKGYREIGM